MTDGTDPELTQAQAGEQVDGRVARWDEETFARLVGELVNDTAPRMFALVEEFGERDDGQVFAWGVQFDGRAALLTPEGRLLGTFGSAASAHTSFGLLTRLRLVWRDRDASTAEPAAEPADRRVDALRR